MDNENLVDYKYLMDEWENEYLHVEQAGVHVELILRDTAMVARCITTLTDEIKADPHAVQALKANGLERPYVIGYYTDRPDGEEIIVADELVDDQALILTRTTRVSYGLRG